MSLFPLTSQIDAVREYFSRMDLEMLDLVLEDAQYYSGVPKSEFLKRLDAIFEQFRNSGDKQLNIYRGICGDCRNACRGYTISGPESGHYINLLFEERNGVVVNICDCCNMLNQQDFVKTRRLTLDIDSESAEELPKDEDYLDLLANCRLALSEFDQFREIPVMIRLINLWLLRHRELFEDCLPWFMYQAHFPFFELYRKLKHVSKIHLNKNILQAEYLSLNRILDSGRHREEEVLSWLLRNERFGRSEDGNICMFSEEEDFVNGKILLSSVPLIYLDESEFRIIYDYEKLFERFYFPMLRKYSVFSQEEIMEMEPFTDEYNMATSLSYNIRQRELLS